MPRRVVPHVVVALLMVLLLVLAWNWPQGCRDTGACAEPEGAVLEKANRG